MIIAGCCAQHVWLVHKHHHNTYLLWPFQATSRLSVFKGALTSSNLPLDGNEALVILTGGTPEAVVAAIALGYKHVIYVSDRTEVSMMTVPTPDEENAASISYRNYQPPTTSELPNYGVLAADAIRLLTVCLQNYVNRKEGVGCVKLQPVGEFLLPSLTTYAYIPLTGQIIARRVTEPNPEQSPVKPKGTISTSHTPPSKQGGGSQKRKQLGEDEPGQDDDDGVCVEHGDEEEDEEEERDDDNELDELDKLIAKKNTKPKAESKKRAKGAAKKKARASKK